MLDTVLLFCIVVLLGGIFVCLYNLLKGLSSFRQYVEQIVSEKLKSKLDIINEMSVVEAHKWDIRLQQQLKDWMEAFATLLSNRIGEMLGGKKKGGYREGGGRP